MLDGHFEGSIAAHNSGFATLHNAWPNISFENDAKLSVDDDENMQIPTKFSLHDNFPNPFNPSTTIRFDLPIATKINLTIYNMLGQKVKTLKNSQLSAGYHSVNWNATNDQGFPVSAGMYFYQIRTNEFVKTKKMLLLK